MKLKHWAGYGCVNARKVKEADPRCLHIHVEGDHERGIVLYDDYDLFRWLVMRFDKDVCNYSEWHQLRPIIDVKPGWRKDLDKGYVDTCDYYFTY